MTKNWRHGLPVLRGAGVSLREPRLADAHALIRNLADDAAPAAARQAAAVLRDADSEYTLQRLASALEETVNWLAGAHGDALTHIPGD